MNYSAMKRAAAAAVGICLAVAVISGHDAEAKPGKTGMPRPPAPDESWKNPVDPYTGQVNYNWMLMSAVIHSDLEYIKKALDNGADINQKSGNTTPLHEAIFNLDLEVVSYLVERKADVNILNRWGYSPLAWCYEVQGSDEELAPIAAALKKAGAKEIAKDTGEKSPFPWSRPTPETLAQYNANILFCAQQPNCDLGMLNRFLKKGADPNTPNSQGIPAIVFGILRGNERFVKLLVENKADVNRLSTAGSPLGTATYYGNMNMVKLLVENGAKLDVPDNGEGNPLIAAFQRNHFEVVRYLIDQGANTKGITGNGNKAPIHFAAGSGDMELTKILIKKGADIMATDDGGWDAMIHAAWGENGAMVDYLKSLGADINRRFWNDQVTITHMMLRDTKSSGMKKLLFLISKGADLKARDAAGFTPLFYALFYNNPDDFAKELIKAGSDVNAESGDGYTVLCRAFIEGRDSIGDLLIKRGADINKKNSKGFPMIVLCAEYGYLGPLKAFIKRKADLNAVDEGGRTALHAAAQAGKKDIYNLLLKSGARKDIRDRNGRTAAECLKK